MICSCRALTSVLVFASCVPWATAQQQPPPPPDPHQQHQHAAPDPKPSSWMLMQDGVAFLTFNRQGGPRGAKDSGELVSQNWWMGMVQRPAGVGTLQFNLMLSLDPATQGNDGYREIFQAGEALDGLPLIDRQHPHDFLMQAAIVWRAPLPRDYRLTLAGAPVGEPALGPVAFMHRSSAYENPTAPLGHHTFDSTHIAMGVLTGGLARGPFEVESSLFRGREPDDQRWDLMDPGPLDSWSVRGWYRPSDALAFQLSHGFLTGPEELEEGNVRRTTISGTWKGQRGQDWTSATVAYGRNDKRDRAFNAFLAEGTHVFGRNTAYGRLEILQVETDLLRFGAHGPDTGDGHAHDLAEPGRADPVTAVTLGGVRRLRDWRGWDLGIGADVTFYGVPDILKPSHGERPVSFHVFFRLRPPAPMGRMFDMVMTKGVH
jgi:hypothetical protein